MPELKNRWWTIKAVSGEISKKCQKSQQFGALSEISTVVEIREVVVYLKDMTRLFLINPSKTLNAAHSFEKKV